MRRPIGIDATSALMFLSAIVRLVQIIVWPTSGWMGGGSPPTGIHALSIGLMFLEALVVWFFWRGRYWAQQFVFAMSCVSIVNLLSLGQMWSRSNAHGYWIVANALLGAFLLWYLGTRAAMAWFCETHASQDPAELDSLTSLTKS
jgi:hypothetical protein